MMDIYNGLEWLKSTVGNNVDKIENELKILEKLVENNLGFDSDDVMVDELEKYSYLKLYYNGLDNVYLELRVYEEKHIDDGLTFVHNNVGWYITTFYELEILTYYVIENERLNERLETEIELRDSNEECLQQKNEQLQQELDSLKNEHFELLRDFYSKHKQVQVSTEQPKRTRPRFR